MVDYNALPANAKIAALIRSIGITQQEAAKRCNVCAGYMNRIIAGVSGNRYTIEDIIVRLEDIYAEG